MQPINRRFFVQRCLAGGALSLAGCAGGPIAFEGVSAPITATTPDHPVNGYGRLDSEPFVVEALDTTRIDRRFLRQQVAFETTEAPGTIVVDPSAHYLYLVEPHGTARRYGVAVGAEGAAWSGEATIHSKQAWPDWYPTDDMLQRRPDIVAMLKPLRSGNGIPGGLANPIGARGMYLWRDGKDSLYRVHGTTEPYSVGQSVSSGCIRMINQDVIDLYDRCAIGTKVNVLAEAPTAPQAGRIVDANGWLLTPVSAD